MLLRAAVALLISILVLILLTSASYFKYESLPRISTLDEVVVLRGKRYSVAGAAIAISKRRVKGIRSKLWLYEAKRNLKNKKNALALALLEKAYEDNNFLWPFGKD